MRERATALLFRELDGDERTTAAILECLHIGTPLAAKGRVAAAAPVKLGPESLGAQSSA